MQKNIYRHTGTITWAYCVIIFQSHFLDEILNL